MRTITAMTTARPRETGKPIRRTTARIPVTTATRATGIPQHIKAMRTIKASAAATLSFTNEMPRVPGGSALLTKGTVQTRRTYLLLVAVFAIWTFFGV
jgi:hypothetical protein